MDRRRLVTAVGALALAPAGARSQAPPLQAATPGVDPRKPQPQQAQPVPLAEAFVLLEPYLSLEPKERSKFALAYCALRYKLPAPEAKAVILLENGVTRPLVLGPDGVVTKLPTLAELDSQAELQIDGPPFEFELEVRASLPLAAKISVAGIVAALDQASNALTAMTAQNVKLTAAYFPDGGAAYAELPGGHALPLPSFDFKSAGVTAYFEPAAAPGATDISLKKAPSRIILAKPPPKQSA